jgi:hypothetical protein
MPKVEIVGAVLMQAMAELVAQVLALYRRFWPDVDWGRPVEPARAAAAVGILAIVAPLAFVAISALRLTSALLHDQLLMFLVLLLAPLLVFAAALAALALMAGLVVALGVAADSSGSSTWGWGIVVLGALEVVIYVEAGWHLLAAFTAVVTIIEIVLLLSLARDGGRPDTRRRAVI